LKKVVDGITITGNEEWLELQYEFSNDEDEDGRTFFELDNEKWYLDNILSTHNKVHMPNVSKWLKEFDGIEHLTIDSGIVVKLNESNDAIQVFRFY